jgi:O-antigen/teichoic acid export membrane protein
MNSTRHSLRGAFTLGTASAIDYVLQFILPFVLVRSLDPDEFGEYRVLWLVTNTVMAIAPLYMPQSLFYFLPRAGVRRAPYIANVLWFLGLMGVLGALIVSPWNPLRPELLHGLPGASDLIPAFVLLWVASTLIEWLANTEGRVDAQARIVISLSLARVVIVGAVAWFTRDIHAVFFALAGFALLRCLFVLGDVLRRYGKAGLTPNSGLMRQQFAYAAPFGAAGMLYNLRQQSDQWIAASLFSLQQFAAFSISLVVLPLAGLIRQAVSNAILPAMNARHHQGDILGAVDINRDANTLTAILLFPVLAFLFVFAEEVISLIYTSQYVDGAQPMRMYLLGLVGQALVVNNLLITLAQGGFQMRLNGFFLPIAIVLSLLGASAFGLIGAALGSAVTQWGSHLLSIRHVSRVSKVEAARLIDWPALIHFALGAVLAGVLANFVVRAVDAWSQSTQLLIGALVFSLVYILTVFRSRPARRIYSTMRH